MSEVDVIVIGAGQAGLALSRCLVERRVDHVVLERGLIAERWHNERWDSLRLLTPNWQTRLPHFSYDGPDPDGFMDSAEVAAFLVRYAASFDAPIEEHTAVERVSARRRGFEVATNRGTWTAPIVAIATGYCDTPSVPSWANRIAPSICQLTPSDYRRPSGVPPGGVLVVGASATGIQLAQELREDGRRVIVAVGRHTRVPRTYRGRDIMWWLDRIGILDDTAESVFDRQKSQRQPSFQLVGRPDHASITLAELEDRGVTLAGRLVAIEGSIAHFDDTLIATTVASDAKLASILQRIDAYAAAQGLDGVGRTLDGYVPLWPRVVATPPEPQLDLAALGINTVLWATGYARSYPWLDVPGVLDRRGEVRHDRGVTPAPGLYIIGLPFLQRRNSAFIDGVGADAMMLAEHMTQHLDQRAIA